MPVKRIRIEAHLAVKTFQVAGFRRDQRIDFQQLGVFFREEPVQRVRQSHALPNLPALQTEREGDAPTVVRLNSRGGIDRDGQNPFRRILRHLLDVHSALCRAYERHG